jgi:hypothetical protein
LEWLNYLQYSTGLSAKSNVDPVLWSGHWNCGIMGKVIVSRSFSCHRQPRWIEWFYPCPLIKSRTRIEWATVSSLAVW